MKVKFNCRESFFCRRNGLQDIFVSCLPSLNEKAQKQTEAQADINFSSQIISSCSKHIVRKAAQYKKQRKLKE